jgi:hypothetical protein
MHAHKTILVINQACVRNVLLKCFVLVHRMYYILKCIYFQLLHTCVLCLYSECTTEVFRFSYGTLAVAGRRRAALTGSFFLVILFVCIRR